MEQPIIRFDGWTFDTARLELRNPDGKIVWLTPRLTSLLRIFLANPQQDLSRQFLIDHLWGAYPPSGDGWLALAVVVSRLRKQIECGSGDTIKIRQLNRGYRFCPKPEIVAGEIA